MVEWHFEDSVIALPRWQCLAGQGQYPQVLRLGVLVPKGGMLPSTRRTMIYSFNWTLRLLPALGS